MELALIQRLKENIVLRMQNLSHFLQFASPSTMETRTAAAGKEAVTNQLALLDHSMQKAEQQTLGLCDVCHSLVEPILLEMDYTACVCIEHLSGEERTKLENDLELSVKVQQALLPHALPLIQQMELAAYSQPARIVGGDYFDFLKFNDGAHAVIIADVMGKGMPASMLMASLQASLRIIVPESTDPSEVVTRLNHIFCHNIRLTNFVTLILAKFNEETRTLTYCNAGHNPPLIRRNNGSIEYMNSTGAAIGLIEQTTFETRSFVLDKNESVLLYTDGVVESWNEQKEMFGDERLEEFVRDAHSSSPYQMIADLREKLRAFTNNAPRADDTTIVAMRSIE
jgi:phosphoserine phosphatase RsbU/P